MQGILKSLVRGLALTALALLSSSAFAQAYPTKPIRLVVPSAAGGSTDTIARIVGNALAVNLGVPVVIDNKPGAGGNIASGIVATAAPDGYTLLVPYGGFAINPSLYKSLPFDSVKDFAPVIQLCTVTGILVVNPSLPVHSVKELIALAKAKPGQLNYASAGSGTVTHLAGELFKTMAGVDIVHVPYRGSSLALTDLLGGQVQLMFANIPGTIQHVETGKLRVLAVNSATRSPLLPNVPTVAESGLAGYEASTWFGVLAPAGTQKEIIAKLNAEISRVLSTAEVQATFKAEGASAVGGSPEQFGSFIRAEIEKWGKVVRASGARAD